MSRPPVAAQDSAVCQRRGHHGPFANVEKYRTVPGWEGVADCQLCGSTVRVHEPPPANPARESR